MEKVVSCFSKRVFKTINMREESIKVYREIIKEATKDFFKSKRRKGMPIKIMTEKLIVDGKRYRGLVSWEGFFRIGELPQEYMDSMGAAFYSNPRFDLTSNDKSKRALLIRCRSETTLLEAKVYPEREFQEILSYIKKAGENLKRINQRLKLESWKGKEEFII